MAETLLLLMIEHLRDRHLTSVKKFGFKACRERTVPKLLQWQCIGFVDESRFSLYPPYRRTRGIFAEFMFSAFENHVVG